jgi:hypothetical protein
MFAIYPQQLSDQDALNAHALVARSLNGEVTKAGIANCAARERHIMEFDPPQVYVVKLAVAEVCIMENGT